MAAGHLLPPPDATDLGGATDLGIEGVVRDVLGIQAQVASAAELGLSARLPGIRRSDVREALLKHRTIVRTWSVRGTIHLLPSADLPLWAAVMESLRPWEADDRLARAGLEVGGLDPILEAVMTALDGQTLTRVQVADAVAGRLSAGLRPLLTSMWGDLLQPLAQSGRICFGPPRGPLVTFVRTDQWLPAPAMPGIALDAVQAWRVLLERFVRTYGPVGTRDVARWFGARPADIEPILAEIGPAVRRVKVGRSFTWRSPDVEAGAHGAVASSSAPTSIRLLPQYDAYVLGSYPRESIVPARARERIRTIKRGRFEGAAGIPVLLLDGMVAGVWQHKATTRRVELRIEPFVELSESQEEALLLEVDRIGRFLDLVPCHSIGPLADR